jgi:hypothetical protein
MNNIIYLSLYRVLSCRDNRIKGGDVGGTSSMHKPYENFLQNFSGNSLRGNNSCGVRVMVEMDSEATA